MTFIIFFLTLSTLILIHELGHFTAAKMNGVKVHEFGLGLPPKIFGKKYGETEYTLNWLPIGGFVRIEGEDPAEKVADPKRSFQNKRVTVRMIILLAGVFMNFFLAVVLFYLFFLFNGFVSSPMVKFTNYSFVGANVKNVETVISGIAGDNIKEKVYPGDTIFNASYDSINLNDYVISEFSTHEKQKNVSILSSVKLKDFQSFIDKSEGPVKIYLYNVQTQESRTITVTPSYDERLKRKIIGVYLGSVFYLDYNKSFYTKTFSGFIHSYNILVYSGQTFSNLISYSFATKNIAPVSEGVSGPVGIFSVIQGVLASKSPNIIWILLDLVALLSLSLAFMNMLPIPALDGGRALFVFIEGVTRKKINPVIESEIHKYGMIFLLVLLAIITFKDVLNLF
ncbi:hypothetical protein COV24_02560 [candidate division WWE3 bacterium CG10_big_fil_rev_8_21_14_0_10_32_10]|uniref:Peptidase M50 domain-containing protein n=1 Tax=candidate division WWE3 bacterium CG10_big_fil_rev_8_21_14_0_10_32_10 TaxID=1975090 RepID=A0A2H0RAA3_UNCKA|nr:MAG: hypothetical protein COV24_02560 [candidate division WWE3 bacterium CG10_big_fil_rev_8_21_14_0_10_32_10]